MHNLIALGVSWKADLYKLPSSFFVSLHAEVIQKTRWYWWWSWMTRCVSSCVLIELVASKILHVHLKIDGQAPECRLWQQEHSRTSSRWVIFHSLCLLIWGFSKDITSMVLPVCWYSSSHVHSSRDCTSCTYGNRKFVQLYQYCVMEL